MKASSFLGTSDRRRLSASTAARCQRSVEIWTLKHHDNSYPQPK